MITMSRKEQFDFGPKDAREREAFAVEGFRVDVQHQIQAAMNRRGMTQRDLARRLELTEARVSQIFSENCNLTIRSLARILHALSFECALTVRPTEHAPPGWTEDGWRTTPEIAESPAPETIAA
jgi:transcriptional regulator with XRE-family HTH domain